MGICCSCIGYDPDRDLSDEDEDTRLIFANAISQHYGSFGDLNPRGIYADEEEARRAKEALERVVAETSSRLVDIFAPVPQKISPATMAHFQNSRASKYRDVIAKNPISEFENLGEESLSKSTARDSDEWGADEEVAKKTKNMMPIIQPGTGSFLGNFSDPKSAE